MDLAFAQSDAVSQDAYDEMLAHLRRFTAAAAQPSDARSYQALITDPDTGERLAGLWGQSIFGGFFVDMLVVREDQRGRDLGTRLMTAAEAEARQRGCRFMWLDTYVFQARPFYERLGFEAFAQFEGPAPVYPRYFMKKALD